MNRNTLVVLCCAMLSLLAAACEYSTVPAAKGGAGESCLARNDCGGGLSCINNVCIDSEVPIEPTAKQCDLVECTDKSDCCDEDEQCRCREDRCEFIPDDPCEEDFDCFGGTVCVSGQCRECRDNAGCSQGDQCRNGFCIEGCDDDDDCGAFQACESGTCNDVGCRKDRECVAFTDNPRAKCGDDGQCTVICENDAECNAGGFNFQACVDGVCTFLGCEDNGDCRALFGLPEGDPSKALCR